MALVGYLTFNEVVMPMTELELLEQEHLRLMILGGHNGTLDPFEKETLEKIKARMEQLYARVPKGFSLPRDARSLIRSAERNGWQAAVKWRQDRFRNPYVNVSATRGPGDGARNGWEFQFTWHSHRLGALGRLAGGISRAIHPRHSEPPMRWQTIPTHGLRQVGHGIARTSDPRQRWTPTVRHAQQLIEQHPVLGMER